MNFLLASIQSTDMTDSRIPSDVWWYNTLYSFGSIVCQLRRFDRENLFASKKDAKRDNFDTRLSVMGGDTAVKMRDMIRHLGNNIA